ncbi:hypothetical protein F2Q70_00012662 [Brassica cretica]|uniref:Uncharacterized protein n=1 Tax=Brassica cretica TaxID=69181 RepID=A0A8S9LXR9_BRACR|nr:hypothetical protein F2Q70_00012662 [Brassica cretica]
MLTLLLELSFQSVSSGIPFFKPLRNALNHHINGRLNSSTRFYHYKKFHLLHQQASTCPPLELEEMKFICEGVRVCLRKKIYIKPKEEEYVVNDHFEQPKDELAMERNVIHEQQEQTYTQVEEGKSKRDCQQQYVPRGSLQNQRGHRGARRGYSNARGGRPGDGSYSNGRYESFDNSGGNSYQRSYYNSSRGRGRGGGNGYSYNNHRDSNVTVASSLLCLWLLCASH